MSFFKKETSTVSLYLQEQAKEILSALGGKANLTQVGACITRLRLGIVDFSRIDENRLNELGSKGNIHIEGNQLHIILGKSANEIAQLIRRL